MGKTVLVVEDDIDLIGIYKEILELHEYDVQTAVNGEEGVEKFKQTNLSRRQAEKGGNTDGQIDDLITNAPRILHEIDKQIAEQKAQGVSDDQMKGLYQKKQLLSLVADNQEVINIIGKPIIKKLLGFVKAI